MRCLWTPVSVLRRSDKVIVTVVVIQASFKTRNILKPTFHNCRGGVMLVDYWFCAGKLRHSHSYRRGGWTGVFQNQESPKVQFPQQWRFFNACRLMFQCWKDQIKPFHCHGGCAGIFQYQNILKPNFHNCVDAVQCLWTHVSVLGRYGHSYHHGVCTSIFHNQECPKV